MALRMVRIMKRVSILVVFALPVGLQGCGGGGSEEAAQAFSQPGTAAQMPSGHPDISGTPPAEGEATRSVAGLTWEVPEAWQAGAQRPMRAATYLVAPAPADTEGAECAVFHFGTGQGGDVAANVERWIAQFEQPDGSASSKAARTTKLDVDGLPVTRVEVTGTYTASMGPMGGAKSNKENHQLLGAIVEGPEGAVFFKMTGPRETVGAARTDFDAMIKSVRKS